MHSALCFMDCFATIEKKSRCILLISAAFTPNLITLYWRKQAYLGQMTSQRNGNIVLFSFVSSGLLIYVNFNPEHLKLCNLIFTNFFTNTGKTLLEKKNFLNFMHCLNMG